MKVSFEKTYPNIARWVDEHEGLHGTVLPCLANTSA